MADLQTLLYRPMVYCKLDVLEASLYHDDHSYSTVMSGSNGGATATVPPLAGSTTRTPRRAAPNANNNTATFGDESDRSAQSSAPNAALANGSVPTANSIASTNSTNSLATAKPTPAANNTAQPSFDRGNSIQVRFVLFTS